MFATDIGITAQQALEISCKKEKEIELERLEDKIRYHCVRFNRKVQVRQEDFSVINVKKELSERGIPFTNNVRESYDCDLTTSNSANSWFSKIVQYRDRDAKIILESVRAYIENASSKCHRNVVWSPDGNHQDGYNFHWLVKSLEANGFSACITDDGSVRIDW